MFTKLFVVLIGLLSIAACSKAQLDALDLSTGSIGLVNADMLRDCKEQTVDIGNVADDTLSAVYDTEFQNGGLTRDDLDATALKRVQDAEAANRTAIGIDSDGNHIANGYMGKSQKIYIELVKRGDPE